MLFAEQVCKVDRISEAEKDISNLRNTGLSKSFMKFNLSQGNNPP